MNSAICPGISPEDEAETLWRRAYAVTSPSETAIIYFIGGDTGLIKIGRAKDVRKRLWQLQTGSPIRLGVLASVEAPVSLEGHYHRAFAEHRRKGEWFVRAPAIRREIKRLNDLRLTRFRERRWAEHEQLLFEWWVTHNAIPHTAPARPTARGGA